jgi:transketolase
MRDAFIARLSEHALTDSRINLLVGDLGFGVVAKFGEQLPNQFLNAGIAEQSMVGLAAGMAMAGKKPFVYSIANFPTLRPLEQIRNDVCYHDLDVTIVSVGAGLAYGSLGYTHHAVEDIAIMRALPGMQVFSPCDAMEVSAAVDVIVSTPGPKYIRLGKNREPIIHPSPPNVRGGAPILLREGTDVTVFVTGAIVVQALEVREALAAQGVSVRIFSVPVIKPLNAQALLDAAEGTRGIVTLEEHSIRGGFGSAVLEDFAVNSWRIPILPLALADASTSIIGSQEYLRERAGLATRDVMLHISNFTHENA